MIRTRGLKSLRPGRGRRIEMGEAADDLLNGDACEQCGEWLGDGAGYPQLCSGCKNPKKKKP